MGPAPRLQLAGEIPGPPFLSRGQPPRSGYKMGAKGLDNAVCRSVTPPSVSLLPFSSSFTRSERESAKMASNYVDTTGEEGRFHGPHSSSTTPTGAAASSPRTMRRSFSSASSSGGGGAPKCVCAPATHAGSFKCRLHRTNSQGHAHPHPSPPTSPASAAPRQGVPSSASSRTVEAL